MNLETTPTMNTKTPLKTKRSSPSKYITTSQSRQLLSWEQLV